MSALVSVHRYGKGGWSATVRESGYDQEFMEPLYGELGTGKIAPTPEDAVADLAAYLAESLWVAWRKAEADSREPVDV